MQFVLYAPMFPYSSIEGFSRRLYTAYNGEPAFFSPVALWFAHLLFL